MQSIKHSILETASDIMAQKGIKGTSLADIAKGVGISKGTLYYHYASKDEIIYDLAFKHLNQMTDELLSWVKQSNPSARPEDILCGVFSKIVSNETVARLHLYLLSEAVIGNESLKERFYERYSQWKLTVCEGLKVILKDQNAEVEALSGLILAALDGYTIQKLIGFNEIPLKQASECLLGLK